MLLEVALMGREPVVELDIERRCGAERAANARRGEATDQTEIAHRLAQRRADLLEALRRPLNAIERNEQSQNLVRAFEDAIDSRIAKPPFVRVWFHETAA